MKFFEENSDQMNEWIAMGVDVGISVLGALLIMFVGLRFAGYTARKLEAVLCKRESMDVTVAKFLASLAKYAIIIITVVLILGQFGIETTSLAAVIGAAGLAIGLALQGTLSNVAAGVMLLIFRPFKVGQFVDVAGQKGVVKGISLFVTEMDTGDNVRIIIPNGSVWGSSIQNYNYHDIRRLDQVYGIGYGDDIDKAIDIIKGVIAADERGLKDPEGLVAVVGLGDSSVDIVVRVWCKSGDYWPLNFHLLKAVKEAFDKEDINIPYPCRTVYMENDNS